MNIMRIISQAVIALAIVAKQVLAPVQIPFTETAKADEATTVVPSNYTLTINTAKPNALELKATKGSFDTEIVTPLRAAQAAKAAAEAQAQAAEQAAAAARATQVARVSAAPVAVPALTGSDAEYKLYIYNHESGNNPTRANGSGCLGLGQACPGSKLLAVCPTLDYACEDAFFTNYAIRRYGSWAGAYTYWLSHHNW
ncbi:hypothetical protein H0W80_00400 [Candidatus Saccharibacteria bacterium]|nr:hypothetical protein [Candidatus Saccharibacteria bacterium]